MTTTLEPQPGILDIELYQEGKGAIEGVTDVLKLSANENPYGPSDAARGAFARSAHQIHRYPSTTHSELRNAIAAQHGLDPDRIICGAGSDEIIAFLCQAYAGPGTEVIHTYHGFAMYKISATAAGATPIEVDERDRVVDVDTILDASNDKTRLVFIANPANPTGTMVGSNALGRLADALPKSTLLVLDGAYADYVDGFDGGASLVENHDNVFMTRTFSKIYGLGGLRVGWGYGPKEVIDVLNRIRGPFNIGQAQLDTATAAVNDQAFIDKCRTDNARFRTWLADALGQMGIPSDASHANFILARFASVDEADATNAYLQSQGIIVRAMGGYKLPNCLRITIGDEASCRRVAHAIAAFKESQR